MVMMAPARVCRARNGGYGNDRDDRGSYKRELCTHVFVPLRL
jgi:hypothetical protein